MREVPAATVSEVLSELDLSDLPLKALRHLVAEHDFNVASRVLDAGCGDGSLIRYLSHLGLVAEGFDDSAAQIIKAQNAFAHLDVCCCENPDAGLPYAEHSFDFVFIRELQVFSDDLFSPAAFRAAANLTATVRPGGVVVFIRHTGVGVEPSAARHSRECYERHLSRFPGICRATTLPDGLIQGWFSARGSQGGDVVAALTVPSEPIARSDWRQLGDLAAATSHARCCFSPAA